MISKPQFTVLYLARYAFPGMLTGYGISINNILVSVIAIAIVITIWLWERVNIKILNGLRHKVVDMINEPPNKIILEKLEDQLKDMREMLELLAMKKYDDQAIRFFEIQDFLKKQP